MTPTRTAPIKPDANFHRNLLAHIFGDFEYAVRLLPACERTGWRADGRAGGRAGGRADGRYKGKPTKGFFVILKCMNFEN